MAQQRTMEYLAGFMDVCCRGRQTLVRKAGFRSMGHRCALAAQEAQLTRRATLPSTSPHLRALCALWHVASRGSVCRAAVSFQTSEYNWPLDFCISGALWAAHA